jgi:hypothetical protein
MRKFGLLATVVLLAVVLLASGVGTAAADPQKNQILVTAECDNEQDYTFVINGMSKVGKISGSNQNLVVTEYTVTYYIQGTTNNPLGTDTFDRGNSPQRDTISCTGTTSTILQGLGPVDAYYEFEGFVTPRGK